MSKISENEQYKKMQMEIQGFEVIWKIVKWLWFLWIRSNKVDEAFSKLPEMKEQFNHLSTLPDRFNAIFSERGWIAHESMKVELMEEAIRVAENEDIDIAEDILVKYFTSNEIVWLSGTLRSPNFRRYSKFIEYAKNDTLEWRYYSAVLVLLTIIDWVTSDINNGKWFFAEWTNVVVPNTIAWHENGLNKISELFWKSRTGKTDEDISIPFRHWILHGRDLWYDNAIVVAKCWAFIFAVRDWIGWKEQSKKPKPKESSFTESLKVISETNKQKKFIEKWEERNFSQEYYQSITVDNIKSIDDATPEYRVLEYFLLWSQGNYGKMTEILWEKALYDSIGKERGHTREIYSWKNFKSFSVIEIIDTAPAISTLKANVSFEWNDDLYTFEANIRMMYENDKWDILTRGYPWGYWKIVNRHFYEVEYPKNLKA